MDKSESEIFIMPQEIDYSGFTEKDIIIDLLSKSNLSLDSFAFLITKDENINLKIIKLFQTVAKMDDVDQDSLLRNLQNNSFRRTAIKELFSDSTIDEDEIILVSEVLKNIINSIHSDKGWGKRILQIDLNKLAKEDRERREKITQNQTNNQIELPKGPKKLKEQSKNLKDIVYKKLGGWENVRNAVRREINREVDSYDNNEEYVFRSIITDDFIALFVKNFLREHDNLTNKEWGMAKKLIEWHFNEVRKLRGY